MKMTLFCDKLCKFLYKCLYKFSKLLKKLYDIGKFMVYIHAKFNEQTQSLLQDTKKTNRMCKSVPKPFNTVDTSTRRFFLSVSNTGLSL